MSQYPKWKYHASQPAKIVQTQQQESALGAGWTDSPATVNDPAHHSPEYKAPPSKPVSDGKAHPARQLSPEEQLDEKARAEGFEDHADKLEQERLEAAANNPSMDDDELDEEKPEGDSDDDLEEEEKDEDPSDASDDSESEDGESEDLESDGGGDSEHQESEPEESAEPEEEEKPKKKGLFSRGGKKPSKPGKNGKKGR